MGLRLAKLREQTVPVLVMKFHNEPLEASKAMIYLDTLLELVKKAGEPNLKEPDRQFSWELNQLKQNIKRIENRLK